MNPLGSPPAPLLGAPTPRFACGSIGAGARLGSPPVMPGVEEDARGGPTDEAADESAAESGLVGFLR